MAADSELFSVKFLGLSCGSKITIETGPFSENVPYNQANSATWQSVGVFSDYFTNTDPTNCEIVGCEIA